MTSEPASIALNRFGLGARPGDVARISADPRGALLAELDPRTALLSTSYLPTTAEALDELRDLRMERKEARASSDAPADAPAGAGTPAMAQDDAATMEDGTPAKKPKAAAAAMQDLPKIYVAELAARTERVRSADIGYVERLVAFWSNHFTVKAGSGVAVRQLAGAFEREAIRPHVLGRFEDMLVAATQHPAMQIYLDNATSFGPDSMAGKLRGRGLNENHARELMELHTIGVNGGYTQADVIAVAKILSGWSVVRGTADRGTFGSFAFRPAAHEPGPQTVMGKVYDQRGQAQGLALLADLARAPATANHIAVELARSFAADDPPPGLVEKLAATFRESDGDLMALSRTLVTEDEAWQGPGRFRTPQQYVWSAVRALDIDPGPALMTRVLRTLGQMPWDPPSPAGYDETAATWLAPDAMTSRLDVAEQLATLTDPTVDPATLVDDIFGGGASPKTREAVARAESQRQGLALLLMSPDFQRI